MKIIRKFGLAGLAWFAAASLGHAADLSPAYKAPVKAIAPVATWTGFYIGGNVGYGWDTGSTRVSAPSTGVTKSIDWFGTVRGRLGVLVTPQWLLYGTGGLAYGQTRTGFTTIDVPFGCVAVSYTHLR